VAERLTEALIKRLVWQADQSDIVFDAEVPGFGVRLYKSGSKSFIFDYRLRGRQHRHVLGKVGAWSLEAARQHARSLRVDVDKGIDPFGRQGSAAPQWTVTDAWTRYERDYLPKMAPRAAADTRAIWRDYILPKVGQKHVEDLEFADGERVHRAIARPYRANRTYETLRRVLNLCIKWEWIDRNPVLGLEVNAETPRNDNLTAAEVTALLAALPHTESSDAIRMLLLTGARRGEVLGMKWEHLDLDAGVWTKPALSVKQRRGHRVPLAPAAVEVIRGRPRVGDLVFCRPDGGPIRDMRKAWSWACKRAKVRQLRIHDCRHTVASLLVSNGASLAVVGAILGHSNSTVTNRYAHLLDDPLRAALAGVAEQVTVP
jgi:integrase